MSNHFRMKTWASILALALSLLLAAIAVGQAPPPGGFNGLEEATDLGVCPDYIQPGQVAVTQSVEFTDSDTDAYDITIKTVTVDNLGTAEDSDVTLIEILDETGAVIGSQSNPEFPVIIVVDDVTITDTGSTVASTTLHVRVTVALTATGDHTIRTRLTAHHTESQWLTGTPFAITADDICASTIVTNASPVADAGADQTVDEGDTVTLDGSGSSDADPGDTLTYDWSQTGGPAVTLSDTTAVSPTFTAPQVDVDTVLTFELTVEDGNGGTVETVVQIPIRLMSLCKTSLVLHLRLRQATCKRMLHRRRRLTSLGAITPTTNLASTSIARLQHQLRSRQLIRMQRLVQTRSLTPTPSLTVARYITIG